MPTISPSLIPTKSPGTIFDALTGGDTTLNVRWLTSVDPVFYEVFNRPIADIAVRQLVIAKAVDTLQLRLGHQTLYPYVVQPRVASGTTEVDVPLNWIWDFHASLPKKWEKLRLAKIKRIAGLNDVTDGYSGYLRLIFTANTEDSAIEAAIFSADYQIDSSLTYQRVRLTVVDSNEEQVPISAGESETVTGFMEFMTMDTTLPAVQAFLDLLAPVGTTDANADNIYDNPSVYEIVDTSPGGALVSDDFSLQILSHGTGLLTDSAWNSIPQLDSDIQSWLTSFNYPFDAEANRQSTDGIIIPNGLFREFDITAPAGDQPTGDTSGSFYPVYISRIERMDSTGSQLRLYFATFNVTDTDSGGSPSTDPIEFASLDLTRSAQPSDIIEIVPVTNLLLKDGTDATQWDQHFGRGHVVLSSLWSATSSDVTDFFDAFDLIADPPETAFSQSATRISSFGVSRVPKYVPTIGQSNALLGSSSRLVPPVPPSYDNRYVTEADQGLGTQIDLEAQSGITSTTGIDRYGWTGSLGHKVVKLVIDADNISSSSTFYTDQVLPRLTILLGRAPKFGDFWYNGTRLMFFNGDTWQG